MSDVSQAPSARRAELLELAYQYVLEHGLSELSLRPLATGIGSSPRVLLFLFGSKDGLLRALLARARADELAFLEQFHPGHEQADLASTVRATWGWLADEQHRPLLTLWLEAYSRSLVEPQGPWSGFARTTVDDWLALLGRSQTPSRRREPGGKGERTLALSVLRGALFDLLATNEVGRVTAAVERFIDLLSGG